MAVGKIAAFDMNKDCWDLYIERLEQYFIANSVEDKVKVATLITVVGSEAYELMVNLCTPARPATKTFDQLKAIMKAHLQPKPSVLAERFKFRQRRQADDESIAEYVAVLKKMSMTCNFGVEALKDNLRDQFICGLSKDVIRQRLFAEDEITFEKAFKLAVTIDVAEADSAIMEKRIDNQGGSAGVYQVLSSTGTSRGRKVMGNVRRGSYTGRGASGRGGRRGPGAQGAGCGRGAYGAAGGCKVCGESHDSNTCKFKVYVCRVCNRDGHLKRMCPRLREEQLFAVYEGGADEQVAYNNSEDSDEVVICNNYIVLKDFSAYPPYWLPMTVNQRKIDMEIDTGSCISCISYDCYLKILGSYKLHPSDISMRYYTGERVIPADKLYVSVQYGDVTKELDLYVIKKGMTNLLGRQWINELGVTLPTSVPCNKVKRDNNIQKFDEHVFSSRFKEVFEDGLGRFTGGTVGFALREGARPVFMRARPLPYALREPVERTLDQLVHDGIITPVATSDWATPVVPVMKKDGTIRLCGDFKLTLNKCLQVDHFPVPRVDDLLTKLHGGDKFSKIDLSQAYAQFELDSSKQYTVINTHKGLFMYNRLIYGLASSPGIFQRKLEQLFADLPTVGVFLDDIIITGPDDQAHLKTLTEVFERLRKYGLKVKKEKCTFFAPSVTYLGFVISKKGVHTCPAKITAIKEVAEPRNVQELRSFLGLIMYYAKFVPNVSTILAPLYRLLQKNVCFEWSQDCRSAFNRIKQMLISSTTLAHYSPDLPLVLTTDASSVGVGAVISHLTPEGERPIAYASRVLNSAEKSYSQIEREALSIIYGIKKFHQYLYGRKFTLRTDHKPLVSIFGDKLGIPVMAASRLQRWAVILAGYDYNIEYVRSEKNAADALSRLPAGLGSEQKNNKSSREITYVNFIQNFMPITRKALCDEISKDEVLRKVMFYIQSGWPTVCTDEQIKPYFSRRHELYVDAGCIVWGYRLVIPKKLQDYLLKEVHSGHMGVVKMKSVARSIVWWPGIDAAIESVCRMCTTCTAESTAPARTTPQPWPYEAEVWSRLHLDFMGPIQGASFLVLIDSTTKWIEIFKMTKTTATDVIRVLRATFARFGLPKEVVSDNGPPFSSKEYERFMTFNGIKMTFAPIYHPSSNGAAEGAVKLCKRVVRKALRDGVDVEAALQSYLLSYRNVDHSTTGMSPATLLQRRALRSRLDLLKCRRQIEDKVIQNQRKQVVYAGGTARQLNVGEEVWARNYSGGEKWIGGKIEQKLGSRNYIVGRENGPPIKRHIDQLKTKWAGTIDVPTSPTTVDPPNECPLGTTPALPVTGVSEPLVRTEPRTENASTPTDVPPAPPAPPALPTPADRPKPSRIRKPVKRYGFDFD